MKLNNDMLKTISQAMTSMTALPNRMRVIENRSELLMDFLKEHGLAQPKSVEHRPLLGCEIEKCFANVKRQVKVAGGRIETGWSFLEEIDVSTHTVAHAIWITPQGRRMDITPWRSSPQKRIMFLPDERVATKQGYTAGWSTVIAKDPLIRSMALFNRGLDHVFEEFHTAPECPICIPEARYKELATQVGLHWLFAKVLVQFRLANNGL